MAAPTASAARTTDRPAVCAIACPRNAGNRASSRKKGGVVAVADTLAPVEFTEAIEWAKRRGVVLPDVYYGELQGLARSMSFSIAGVAKVEQLQAVLDSLIEATASGQTFADWRALATDPGGPIRLDLPAHRLENIFRTNLQGHYARGRCEQQKRTADVFPYLMFDAVNDSRTRPSHAAMDGMVARHDDPIWRTWRPPAGYQCRCTLRALTERKAERYMARDRDRLARDPALAAARAQARPDDGWDYDPCAEPTEGLRRALERRIGNLPQQMRGAPPSLLQALGVWLSLAGTLLQSLAEALTADR